LLISLHCKANHSNDYVFQLNFDYKYSRDFRVNILKYILETR